MLNIALLLKDLKEIRERMDIDTDDALVLLDCVIREVEILENSQDTYELKHESGE